MTTPRGCDEIAQMLGMDEDTVRLLFVAYHTLNGDLLTGDWNVSMQTLVNFLAEHSALLDDAQAQQITMLSRIINGSVDGTSYSAAELADLLGMDAGQVRQLYLLYTSRHGDTSAGRSRCSSSWTSCARRCCRTRALLLSSAVWTPASSSRRARSSTRSPPAGAIRRGAGKPVSGPVQPDEPRHDGAAVSLLCQRVQQRRCVDHVHAGAV